jgi:hypothetical protein
MAVSAASIADALSEDVIAEATMWLRRTGKLPDRSLDRSAAVSRTGSSHPHGRSGLERLWISGAFRDRRSAVGMAMR